MSDSKNELKHTRLQYGVAVHASRMHQRPLGLGLGRVIRRGHNHHTKHYSKRSQCICMYTLPHHLILHSVHPNTPCSSEIPMAHDLYE
jgi:hypothetical protein